MKTILYLQMRLSRWLLVVRLNIGARIISMFYELKDLGALNLLMILVWWAIITYCIFHVILWALILPTG